MATKTKSKRNKDEELRLLEIQRRLEYNACLTVASDYAAKHDDRSERYHDLVRQSFLAKTKLDMVSHLLLDRQIKGIKKELNAMKSKAHKSIIEKLTELDDINSEFNRVRDELTDTLELYQTEDALPKESFVESLDDIAASVDCEKQKEQTKKENESYELTDLTLNLPNPPDNVPSDNHNDDDDDDNNYGNTYTKDLETVVVQSDLKSI